MRRQPAQTARRRRRSGTPTVKKSFTLHEDVIDAAGAAVRAGAAENLSAFVEAAIEEKLRGSKRVRLYGAYAEAVRDSVFMADMRGMTDALDGTSGDGFGD